MKNRKYEMPSPEEDRKINKGITSDPDTLPLDDDFFERAKPATRGKQKAPTKVSTTIRLSREVVETYKATGKGWQTRMDKDLQEVAARKYGGSRRGKNS